MKKKLAIILCLLCISSFFAKDCTKKVFKNYFEKSLPTYEYNIRNPFLVTAFYITDLSKFENSVIKVTKENYEITGNGEKLYSDTDIRDVYNAYYKFDSDGRITDEYAADVADDNYYYSKYHKKYYCDGNNYFIETKNFKWNETSVEKYVIKAENGLLTLTYSNKGEIKEKCFAKNKVTETREQKIGIKDLAENLLEKNKIIYNDYDPKTNNKEIFFSRTYLNCLVSSYTKNNLDEKLTYFYDFPETREKGYFKLIENSSETIKRVVNRKYGENDFLIYEEQTPYENTIGDYYYTTVEILSGYDDFFYNHFSDE